MPAKRMTSARISSRLADVVDRLSAANGETRSAFHERALAREALRASAATPVRYDHPTGDPVD